MGHTDPALPTFKGGTHGWDGTQWRKLPLLWGYSDRWYECGAWMGDGATEMGSTSAVPPGYIYILQKAAAMDLNSAPSSICIRLYTDGGGYGMVGQDLSPVQGKYLIVDGPMVLKEGDYVTAVFGGTTNLDELRLRVWGYKMAIAE